MNGINSITQDCFLKPDGEFDEARFHKKCGALGKRGGSISLGDSCHFKHEMLPLNAKLIGIHYQAYEFRAWYMV